MGRYGREELAPADGLRNARPAPPRGAAAVRQGRLPAADRRGRRKARLLAGMAPTMKLPRSGRGRLSLEVIEHADQERPPMIRIPEYLERRRGVLPATAEPALR